MQLHYDADTEKFRTELRAWIAAHRPGVEEKSYGGTISAGASEIQRNIIAQRVLGLARR